MVLLVQHHHWCLVSSTLDRRSVCHRHVFLPVGALLGTVGHHGLLLVVGGGWSWIVRPNSVFMGDGALSAESCSRDVELWHSALSWRHLISAAVAHSGRAYCRFVEASRATCEIICFCRHVHARISYSVFLRIIHFGHIASGWLILSKIAQPRSQVLS